MPRSGLHVARSELRTLSASGTKRTPRRLESTQPGAIPLVSSQANRPPEGSAHKLMPCFILLWHVALKPWKAWLWQSGLHGTFEAKWQIGRDLLLSTPIRRRLHVRRSGHRSRLHSLYSPNDPQNTADQ